MRLSEQEAKEARKRALAYEANMAIEGLAIPAEDRAFIDSIYNSQVGYEEGVEMVKQRLIDRGIIPSPAEALAAE